MIYNKDASFPYPVLTNSMNGYENSIFEFDIVGLSENDSNYIFEIKYEIGSSFIKNLIRNEKAVIVFIISSQDNYFIKLNKDQTEITVSKSRVSLSNRTSIQLNIQSVEEISMDECKDLTPFYNNFKDKLKLKKHVLLGYSNIIKYQGSKNKPLQLFEKAVDKNQKAAFQVELSENTIVLCFKDSSYLINDLVNDKNIQNMYLYTGLSRALLRFIDNYSEEEYVDIELLSDNLENDLDQKLLDLMKNKGVKEISYDQIDEVIDKISDRIIEKYIIALKRGMENGN
ncbi:hypothetical protein [Mammaliicoccus sciuri]|uniref:hypothetical protein n=1 Tax=Mammaliicoccus sciuri TaxID=1296 RepID=UPI001E2ED864|nr:hypothetical protein [Mammaliicoccus sciuri]MCD8819090.1 hypothetical protein [Mammaliicoccus sciuri]